MVRHLILDQAIVGSSPTSPTQNSQKTSEILNFRGFFCEKRFFALFSLLRGEWLYILRHVLIPNNKEAI